MLANTLSELALRSLIQDMTDRSALERLPKGSAFYVGFDPTAPYLQLGNLIPLIVVIHLTRAGLKPIILFGGATGCIGDPSGKSKERILLDRDTINQNITEQQKKAREILVRANCEALFVDNNDWTSNLSFIDFLRDIGKFLTVNYMLAKDSVKSRLEAGGISFTEFSYMLLQAYDFYHLHTTQGCKLQIGGADQWGNMTAGLELIRKKGGEDAHALSIPLITNSTGAKFGKSEGGAIWLDERGTTPYTLQQFLLNTSDVDAVRYLKLFTFLPLVEIDEIDQQMRQSPETRVAQRRLADELCRLVHGQEKTELALRGAAALFKSGPLELEVLQGVIADIPSSSLPRPEVMSLTVVELLDKVALVPSRSEAKKLIKNGGVYLNNERVLDGGIKIVDLCTSETTTVLLRVGKKRYHAVTLVE
jgi:tyrosyl-tRNA synthetase